MELVVDKVWLSEKEAVFYTSLSRTTLQECRDQGKITHRMYGRKVIYNRVDLDNFIEKNTELIKSTDDRMALKKRK